MAFADVSYPGDDRLTVYDATGREYDETYQLLRGRMWPDFPVVEFMHGDTPIPEDSMKFFSWAVREFHRIELRWLIEACSSGPDQ